MPDPRPGPPRRAWRVLAAAGTCAIALAVAVAATGGGSWPIGPWILRVHEPWRLLGGGLVLAGLAAWFGGEEFRAMLCRAREASDRSAGWIAALSAAAVMVTGLVKGTWVAGSADAYGYVSQALLWMKGLPVQAVPLAARVSWPDAEWALSPLGYRPGVGAGTIVPTYPPGLPLAMAAVARIGGPDAMYWVVPALGAAAVWLTYLLGRRYAGAAGGAAAALLLAVSPVFLYQLVQPMSDVPVTAWWLLALWGAASGRPFAAGAGAAAALLTRPNLAPAAAAVMAAVAAGSWRQHRKPRAVVWDMAAFALPPAVAASFLLWLNWRLYGSPFLSGYGAASDLFALANVPINLGRYTRWMVETQTPVVLLGVAAPFVAEIARRRDPGRASPGPGWIGLGFIALVAACYVAYSPFEEWWYLRFLLPALPVLLILTASAVRRLASAVPAVLQATLVAAGVASLAWFYVSTASARSVFELNRLESRYAAAGAFASRELPGNAILLSHQESGPLRMYGGRMTVRFDRLDPQGLDSAIADLDREGYRPYFVVEAWEESLFRDRFAGSSLLGRLDWPPAAEIGRPVRVRFYDPRDRRRYLAGEPVPTAEGPIDARGRR
jgi:hypothetical protein